MLLSDGDMRAAIERQALRIDPFREDRLQPASYDVTLSGDFLAIDTQTVVDPLDRATLTTNKKFVPTGSWLDILPGRFYLATTVEVVGLDASLAARVEGKSTLGRCGLAIHTTAGWIDPGFTGQVTLELSNVGPAPIRLRPGMAIGQLCVFALRTPSDRPYGSPGLGSHYQGQVGTTGPRS